MFESHIKYEVQSIDKNMFTRKSLKSRIISKRINI